MFFKERLYLLLIWIKIIWHANIIVETVKKKYPKIPDADISKYISGWLSQLKHKEKQEA